MARKDREEYRPRRALVEPSEQPRTEPEPKATPPHAEPSPSAGPTSKASSPVIHTGLDPDEPAPPLYRDERRTGQGGTDQETRARMPAAGAASEETRLTSRRAPDQSGAGDDQGGNRAEETQILSRARARQNRQRDTDATTILARTPSGSRVRSVPDDDLDDDEGRPTTGRGRVALLVGAVAAVVILGLVVGSTLIRLTEQPSAMPSQAPSSAASTSASSEPSSSPSETEPAAILDDSSMMSAAAAKEIDDERTWKVALTQRGSAEDSPQPACLGGDPVEGQPSPQQTMLRLLSSSGKDAPGVLHRADAFATPEEAAQAYAIASKSLGGCTMSGAYIYSGRVVTGLGDQSLGLIVHVADGDKTEYRSVVLSRTGRVVNVVDVAKPEDRVGVGGVADATATVIDTQCTTSGGACSDDVTVKDGPPPVGGDEPGFLATGDLPPVGDEATGWVGDTPRLPDSDQVRGSGCETVDWAKVEAESRAHRTYLLEDSSSKFGLDQVVIATESNKDARDLVEKVKGDWDDCPERQLTATVPDPVEISGTGAKETEVNGWVTTVAQRSTNGTEDYRVGIVSAGPKVVFTFLNPVDDMDLSDSEFERVTTRAGERATQVK